MRRLEEAETTETVSETMEDILTKALVGDVLNGGDAVYHYVNGKLGAAKISQKKRVSASDTRAICDAITAYKTPGFTGNITITQAKDFPGDVWVTREESIGGKRILNED